MSSLLSVTGGETTIAAPLRRPGNWLGLAASALTAVIGLGVFGFWRSLNITGADESCASAGLRWDDDYWMNHSYPHDDGLFPFGINCNAYDNTVPPWVNATFVIALVVTVMATTIWLLAELAEWRARRHC